MDAEIIAIGSELLLGTTVDTNSAYLARQIAAAGVNLFRKHTVGDNATRLATTIGEALQRADLVICTGGLGPTVDDVTREGVAEAFGRPLEFHPELLAQIEARFASFGRKMSESNRRQAYLPQGARAIENPRGTAPGFIVEDARGTLIALPGVPSEMRFLFETAVLPYLRDERGVRDVILVRTLHASGMTESQLGEQIADLMQASNPTVGISAKRGRYELRIGARAQSQADAEALIAPVVETMQLRLGSKLLGERTLDERVADLMEAQGQNLALYEGLVHAPVYRAVAGNQRLLDVLRGLMIHPLDRPTDDIAAEALALAGAIGVQERWRSSLALGVQAASSAGADGFRAVSVALVTPTGHRSRTLRYDLRHPDSWEAVGTLALETLRRFLLNEDSS